MADNIAVSAGSGTTVAADEVVDATLGTVKAQFIKIMDGTLDGTTKAAVGANGLAVDVKAAVVTSGTITTVSTVTNLSQLGGAAVPIGAGVEATAVRVTLPTDGTGVVRLGAGTAGIGKLTANSGVDIGDVDVTSAVISSGTLTTVSTVSALGTSTTGPQKAEDVASANGDAGIAIMAVRKDTPANTSGTDGDYETPQMSAGRLWTSATIDAALPAGTNGIGKLTANSGVDIGDVDVASIAAGDNNIGNVDIISFPDNEPFNVAQINGVAPSMGAGATGTGVQRVVLANDAGKTLLSAGGSASSSGDNTIVAAGTNKLKVYAFSLSTVSTTAVTCIFKSGAGGTELWRVILQTPASVAGGANLVVQPPAWIFATASATLLNLSLSAAVAVNWSVSYFDEA